MGHRAPDALSLHESDSDWKSSVPSTNRAGKGKEPAPSPWGPVLSRRVSGFAVELRVVRLGARVVSGVAVQLVLAGAALEGVVAEPSAKDVPARAPLHLVVAQLAVQVIAPGPPGER